MKKLTFKTVINAPRVRVWDILWGDATYPLWTAPFSEGSKVETDWAVGSKVLFLDSNNAGMVSVIAEKNPPEYMSFRHLGEVKNGVEDVNSEEAQKWAGTMENYILTTVDGQTELEIEMLAEQELDPQFKDFFEAAWPKSLDILKELSEKAR